VANQKNVLGLFDFSKKAAVAPPRWIPATASSCLITDWNKSSALKSSQPIYDAFIGEPGAWSRLLEDFKFDPDMQLDIQKFVAALDDRTILMSHLTKDGSGKNDQPVLGIKIKRDSRFVMDSIKRAVGSDSKIQIVGFEGIEATWNSNVEDVDTKVFQLPDEKDENEIGENETKPEKRFFVTANGFLLVSNNKEQIRLLLKKGEKGTLVEADDYIQLHAALGKLTDSRKIGIRSFGRMDLCLKPSYELIRRGEFEWLPWLDRREELEDGKPKPKRVARFDGSSLPKNFEKVVAPYLGLFGWVLENELDGWVITGCVLKK